MQELQDIIMAHALVHLDLFLQLGDIGRSEAESRRYEQVDNFTCGYTGIVVVDCSEYSVRSA